MFIFFCVMFLLLHKIHTSAAPPFHLRSQSLLQRRADENSTTAGAPSNSTTSPVVIDVKVANNATSGGNGTARGNGTSLNGTAGNTTSTPGSKSTASPPLNWATIVGEPTVSKEDSEECSNGFLQCFCDAVTEMMGVSSEEDDDDDDDKLTDGIFGIFGK